MKLKELIELDNCPEWIKNKEIKVSDEDIIMGPNRQIIWIDGVWINGTWRDGIWRDGIWKYGTWEDGTWKGGVWKGGNWGNGTWEDGVWEDGLWTNGAWIDGIWKDGIWKCGTWGNGVWKNGIWEKGTWKNGDWEHGIWEDGTWKNGWVHIGKYKRTTKYSTTNKSISIGCMNKTLSEWEHFFNSDETERNTPQFEEIRKSYLLAKLAIELDTV
jgi:hypothetical protein